MGKVNIKQLLELEIGQELEIQENLKKFVRVPGGWILENHYPAYNNVIPVFIPEPIEPEINECVTVSKTTEYVFESDQLTRRQANAFNNLVGRFQFICNTLDDVQIQRVQSIFKMVFKEYGIEPSDDSKKAFGIDPSE